MQVWNVLHAAHWKHRTQKWCKKSPSAHHRTTLFRLILATKACIDNRKKVVKQQYLLHMSAQYDELRPTSGWDRFVSFRHPIKFQRLWRLGVVTARNSSTGLQPNFAALNRGRHLYSQGGHHVGIGPPSSYDMIRSMIFTCTEKLTYSQLSLSHGTNKQKKSNGIKT